MTQGEKQLLLIDLCARLPYKVMVLHDYDKKFKEGLICYPSGLTKYENRTCITAFGVVEPLELDEIKPYLRPMSSMTEEEMLEFDKLGWRVDELDDNTPWVRNAYDMFDGIDWLNAHHFDFRGLIEKGLAIEAPEGIYKIE